MSIADGKFMGNNKVRLIHARNGIIFIQAWIELQLKREKRRDITRWLEAKKARLERQIKILDRRVQSKGDP